MVYFSGRSEQVAKNGRERGVPPKGRGNPDKKSRRSLEGGVLEARGMVFLAAKGGPSRRKGHPSRWKRIGLN